MAALSKTTVTEEIGTKRKYSGRSPKTKFRVFGEEMIEKEVKSSGNSGRIYLPSIGSASTLRSSASIDADREFLQHFFYTYRDFFLDV